MLTKLRIRNFKQFDDVEIELGQSVVFIGPNNSGKTTALQALALWWIGYRSLEPHLVGTQAQAYFTPDLTPLGTAALAPSDILNRYDLNEIPVPYLSMLWRNLQFEMPGSVPIEIGVFGQTGDQEWMRQLRFTHVNEESFTCMPIQQEGNLPPNEVAHFALLPPMSGLASVEPRIEAGRINVLIGEGRTAEVLRNLCLLLYEANGKLGYWDRLVSQMREQFGVELLPPQYIAGRGEIRMAYKDRSGITLDLSAAGRGMLQVLLLLAYMYNNPGVVLLLDEPDAHLEILRQQDIYLLLTSVANELRSQLIIATHSEVILDLAAKRKNRIVAFVGKPHIMRKLHNVAKSLSIIHTEDYTLAEQKGWILYVEDESDWQMLKSFAERLNHESRQAFSLVFRKDLQNNKPKKAKEHFDGLREAVPDLLGIAVFDRISQGKIRNTPPGLDLIGWRLREIENYVAQPETLLEYARAEGDPDQSDFRVQIMNDVIADRTTPFALRDRQDRFWRDTKMSDDYLVPLFADYYHRLGQYNPLSKANLHRLVPYIPDDQLDPEITEKLDAILAVAQQAKPLEEQ